MRQTVHHCSRLLLVLAVFFASGSHWAVLQTMAWSTMLLDYSRTGSVAEAVAKTFDGKHPCRLCVQVRKASTSEGEKESPVPLVKVQLFHEEAKLLVLTPPQRSSFPDSEFRGPVRVTCPAVPPPRQG